jgi:RHS repeat-associated protein
LGSTSVAYRADGAETLRQFYYPWGGLRGSSDPVVPTDVGFTGQRLDTSTGLMFYQARYYDPLIGRFISPDSLVPNPSDPQDLNRYSYVSNNPVTFTDPSGHGCPWPWDDGANGCFGGGVVDVVTGTLNPIDGCVFQKAGGGCAGTDPRDYVEAAKGAADWFITPLETVSELYWELGLWLDPTTPYHNVDFDVIKPSPGYEDEFGVGGGIVTAVSIGALLKGIGTRAASTWSTRSATNGAASSIEDLLRPRGSLIGKAGTDESIREPTGGLPDAQAMFEQLSQGGTVVEQTSTITRVELANNGGFVQLRTVMSRSPGTVATIDVNIPGLEITKLKFNP